MVTIFDCKFWRESQIWDYDENVTFRDLAEASKPLSLSIF